MRLSQGPRGAGCALSPECFLQKAEPSRAELALQRHLQSSALTPVNDQAGATGQNLGCEAQNNKKGILSLLSQVLH